MGPGRKEGKAGMNILPFEKQVQVVAALTEGCSIRATERLTDVHRDTIMRLGVRVGDGCARLHDAMMRGLTVNLLQLDEQWGFVGKKQKRVEADDPQSMGDAWLFIAIDATKKAIVSYVVGKRTAATTKRLCWDVRSRVMNRPQVSTDGFSAYPDAIDLAFNGDVDFGQIIKLFRGPGGKDAAHRYSPGEVIAVEKSVVNGAPAMEHISTSYAERFNLSTRMQVRRMTRLTNGFSKKIENHRAAIALYVAWYNLCRVHEALRITPAMALGVTDRVWTIGELVQAALTAPEPQPLPEPPGYMPYLPGMSATQAKKASKTPFRVIKGGRS